MSISSLSSESDRAPSWAFRDCKKNGNFSAPVVGSEPEKLVLLFFYLCQRFDRCKILGPPVQHALIKIILFDVFTLLPLPLFPFPVFVIILFY